MDEAKAVKTGRLLGAKTLVTGTYQRRDEQIRLLFRALDVETGQVVATAEGNLPVTTDALMQMLGPYPGQ